MTIYVSAILVVTSSFKFLIIQLETTSYLLPPTQPLFNYNASIKSQPLQYIYIEEIGQMGNIRRYQLK